MQGELSQQHLAGIAGYTAGLVHVTFCGSCWQLVVQNRTADVSVFSRFLQGPWLTWVVSTIQWDVCLFVCVCVSCLGLPKKSGIPLTIILKKHVWWLIKPTTMIIFKGDTMGCMLGIRYDQQDEWKECAWQHEIDHHLMTIWVNYNKSPTWIFNSSAILGWFPLLTMIPVRSWWNLPR